jgi:DNA-binding NarL/FixJ family response regulator
MRRHAEVAKILSEIATEMSMNSKTISTFHSSLFEKAGVRNNVELINYTQQYSLIESHPNL